MNLGKFNGSLSGKENISRTGSPEERREQAVREPEENREVYFLVSQKKFCGLFRFLPPVNDPPGEIPCTHEQPS
jgi:hypothetical protein